MLYSNDNLAKDNIKSQIDNLEEYVVDYWTRRVEDFSQVREHELESDMSIEWVNEIMKHISPLIKSEQEKDKDYKLKILDVGTGVGYFAILLAQQGMEVTGIDLTPDMISKAKKLAKKHNTLVKYEVMDAMNLDYANESYDVVITRNLTWTLPDVKKAYTEWYRVLKKNGILLNFDANYAKMHSLDKTLINEKTSKEPYGHQGMTKELELKNAYIAKSMDIGKHMRPAYDVHIMDEIGFKNCIIDINMGKKILKEKDIEEAPLFMIKAGK